MHYQLVSPPFNLYCVWHSSNCLSPGFKRRVENIVCIHTLNSCPDGTLHELFGESGRESTAFSQVGSRYWTARSVRALIFEPNFFSRSEACALPRRTNGD